MAGYLFTFSDYEALERCIETGVYSPFTPQRWSAVVISTLADLVTMKPGDNVYFFSKRIVYGIGEIVSITPDILIAENHPKTSASSEDEKECLLELVNSQSDLLPEGKTQRWIIAFKPSPKFFKAGIDMDDLLSSNPHAFRSLRVFWKRTFIKLDDEENLAFMSAIIRKNISEPNCNSAFDCNYQNSLNALASSSLNVVEPDIKKLVKRYRDENGALSSEMILELALLHQLSAKDPATCKVFGTWDYLSHQVTASPMKAVDYMDRIDVFGYSWINGYEGKFVENYMVCELKAGELKADDAAQVMKYVDWVCDEYANGDYSRINAYLVGSKVTHEELDRISHLIIRNYITGHRPPINNIWNQLRIITYHAPEDGRIEFTLVEEFASVAPQP